MINYPYSILFKVLILYSHVIINAVVLSINKESRKREMYKLE